MGENYLCVNVNYGWKCQDLCVNLNYGWIWDYICVNLNYGWKWYDVTVYLIYGKIWDDLCVNLNYGWKWSQLFIDLNYGWIQDYLCLNLNYGLGGKYADSQAHTQTHQYFDFAWPRGRAEWKKGDTHNCALTCPDQENKRSFGKPGNVHQAGKCNWNG